MNFLSENNNSIVTQNHFPMETSNGNVLPIDNGASDVIQNENKVPTVDKSCNNKSQNINQVWTKENFDSRKGTSQKKGYLKASLSLDIKPLKTSWASKKNDEAHENEEEEIDESEFKVEAKEVFSPTPSTPDKETASPSHHARRPMNAFLIFCKKHRPIVRQRFPHLENRGVTRILGEWWALLDADEKSSYTDLAKEVRRNHNKQIRNSLQYKDAFFSANPDFKWYKLPAPPLRTLNTRPVGIHKTSSPLASPTQVTPNSAEFTPGKLADETQLGNLTSLMKINSSTTSTVKTPDNSNISVCEVLHANVDDTKSNSFVNNNNNNVENDSEQHKQLLTTPVSAVVVADLPPKPIKKRKFEEFGASDNKKVARNIFDFKPDDMLAKFSTLDQNDNSYMEEQLRSPKSTEHCTNGGFPENEPENMTQQELMNKVVDSMFPEKDGELPPESDENGWSMAKQKLKETRKSGRSCKGKRYAEFMMEGKLLGNKQMKKFTQYKVDVNNKFENALNNKIENMMHNKSETQTPKLDLGDTIKRLAERTNTKLEDICDEPPEDEGVLSNKNGKRRRTESENSDDSLVKMQSDFNLDLRIAELPSLSYETFLQRKKESKKRKSIRSKSESSVTKAKVTKLSKSESNSLVGSKKRKNKNSITRLEKPADSNYMNNLNNDLYGLATLAEVAANTEKIN